MDKDKLIAKIRDEQGLHTTVASTVADDIVNITLDYIIDEYSCVSGDGDRIIYVDDIN